MCMHLTGGTMLLTPNLDYQLMEHWSPSLPELLRIEQEEIEAARTKAEPPTPPAPKTLRRQFSVDAENLMQADVLEKVKDLICAHKPQLLRYYEAEDASRSGRVPISV